MCIDVTRRYSAEMVTSKGTLTIALDPVAAPKTVNNFVFLARYHYFDGIFFHRVIPGFVLQGGDPKGTGTVSYTHLDVYKRQRLRDACAVRLGHSAAIR